MLAIMKSAHKKTRQAGYRSFPDLIDAYSAAVESIVGAVKHTDGNDLGVGHPIEYLYAHLDLMSVPERAEFVRTLRRSYTAWLERREALGAQQVRGPAATMDLDRGPSREDDTTAKVKASPKRTRGK